MKRKTDKEHDILASQARMDEISDLWPTLPSQDVVFHCLHNYVDATKWVLPPPCAICSRHRIDLTVQHIVFKGTRDKFPLSLDILEVTDPYILSCCVPECLPDAFVYDFSELMV